MRYSFDYTNYKDELLNILKEINEEDDLTWRKFRKILSKYPKDGNKVFSKDNLVRGYRELINEKNKKILQLNPNIIEKIQKRPVRTQSGVTTVTVLTKPFPCPANCLYCPNDVKMPKSYLRDEPGAQRALRNKFHPYLQTFNRLKAIQNIGHNTQKIELIILGGTWSYYPEKYQIWFIKECFRAMNDFGSYQTNLIKGDIKKIDEIKEATWEELFKQQIINESAKSKNVGLVIETRPDYINEKELIKIRKFGATKVQIGVQSLNNDVLKLNNRGHGVTEIQKAFQLLRSAGFKIHAHWMANLFGSNVKKDIEDFKKLFSEKYYHPDELKIYPCSLIKTAPLMKFYKEGKWKPYTYEEMLKVLSECIKYTPEYCRLTRIIRDFSSDDIEAGNKKTNFRQIAENELKKQGIIAREIRAREIKSSEINRKDLEIKIIAFETSDTEEKFLQFVNNENKIAGFLRLSLPINKNHEFIEELKDSAIIREIHVYGKTVDIGEIKKGKAQHLGLGTELITKAKEIAFKKSYKKLSVISAIGTREYYRKKGFKDGDLYQYMNL